MERETLIYGMTKVNSYLRLYATVDTEIKLNNFTYNFTGPDLENPNDYLTFSISIFTGFIDGAFNAPNTSYCRASLLKFSGALENTTEGVKDRDENDTVWYSTRMLKYFHPSAFHCYYAGKEAYLTAELYVEITSWKDIMYNLIY